MKSTLTLPYLTCIDHAYIDTLGHIRGRSYHASFTVSGEVDETNEKVVIDFSKIKKLIKSIVDDHTEGFDHKLWVSMHNIKPGSNFLKTENVLLTLPCNAFKLFEEDSHLNISTAETEIAQHVQYKLHEQGFPVDVTCMLNTDPLFIHAGGVYSTFSYVHGLKDSSAYGCQNLAHGHLSYLQLLPRLDTFRPRVDPISVEEAVSPKGVHTICAEICKDLDNTVFVFAENVTSPIGSSLVEVEYMSQSRGEMLGTFINSPVQKVVVLETETTVEYLAEYINAKYSEVLKEAGVDRFIVSEGLSKGVMFDVI